MSSARVALLSLISTACLAFSAQGQDPLADYPENYKVLLENDRVRVLDFQLKKGAKEAFHAHPTHVAYVLTGFKIQFTFPDGRTAIRETKDGDVLFSEAVTHSSENIGASDAHGILIEMKGASHEITSSDELLTAVTFITGKQGKEEDLQPELLALSAPTRAEPGNVTYDLYQSPERPNEFMRFEVWRDAQALEAHKVTPHLKASFQKRQEQGWMTEITLWKRVSEDQ
ncbi:MAG: antibiotic biosynthesis monooxygenase [Vicinamibacteria bacterium]